MEGFDELGRNRFGTSRAGALGRREFDGVAEAFQLFEEPSDLLVARLRRGAVEAELLEGRLLVLEEVPDGPEHGCGHGDDGLLRAAAALDALELRLEVALLRSDGAPRRLHQDGLEPRS